MRAFFLLLLLTTCHLCPAQTPNSDIYRLHIRKATGTIQLDGLLDEPDWKTAEAAGHFKLNFPNDTAYSNFPTEAYLDRKSTRLNSSHSTLSRMPSSA